MTSKYIGKKIEMFGLKSTYTIIDFDSKTGMYLAQCDHDCDVEYSVSDMYDPENGDSSNFTNMAECSSCLARYFDDTDEYIDSDKEILTTEQVEELLDDGDIV